MWSMLKLSDVDTSVSGERSMDVPGSTGPPAPRVRALVLSREKWKARAAAKHREIRALRVKVRDLRVSRDLRKRRAAAASSAGSAADREGPAPGEARPSRP